MDICYDVRGSRRCSPPGQLPQKSSTIPHWRTKSRMLGVFTSDLPRPPLLLQITNMGVLTLVLGAALLLWSHIIW